MKRIAAALMLVASTSAHAQTFDPVDPISGVVQSATPVYDPVEIQPKDIPDIGKAETPTNLGDDATKYVDLGFTFSYFGQDFTNAWISSNGFLSFQSGANLCCNGELLENAQRNTIYQYWTDLISWSGSPYYSKKVLDDGTNAFLVGWYGTNEYGGNRPHSFEMTLSDGGKITFNYLETFDMNGHIVTAGLTGPTATDNILLFRGSDTSTLSQRAYGFNFQTGVVTPIVDCNITPMDSSCPTQNVVIPGVPSMVPEVTPTQNTVETITAVVEQVVQSAPEEIQQVIETANIQEASDAAEQAVAEQVAAIEQQVAEQQQTTTVATTASVATTAAKETTTKSADRLSPTQLAALNAGGAVSSEVVQSSSASSSDVQQSGDASAKSSMQLFTTASNSSIAMAEAEQQQQLQSSIDSTSSVQISSITDQSVEVSQISTQAGSNSTSDTKSVNTNYQNQQSMAGTDSGNKDVSISGQQMLQTESVLYEANQQYSMGTAQQLEDDKNTVVMVQADTQQSSVASAESRWQESLASQVAALEALNTIGSQSTNGDNQESPSSLGEGQGEVISQMAYVAGFSAYKLVSLPDRLDFYKPRRIYRNNRPVDAYMSIFKMTAANDSLWKQMVESQYE